MSQLIDEGDGNLALSGRLTSDTVAELELQVCDLIAKQHSHYTVDLAAVTFGSSAAVALMLALLRAARDAEKSIVFANLPAGMAGLLRVSELEDIVPLQQ